MGAKSNIEWTNSTWNPFVGCRKVSPGCKFCYAERDTVRWGKKFEDIRRSVRTFWDPLTKKDFGPLVFTCSFSDFFIEEADQWRDEVWSIIKHTPHLTYQILTKRIERVRHHLPHDWHNGYPNVWLGVSVENQQMAELRIPQLLNTPARLRFLSVEPLLDRVSLQFWLGDGCLIQWVIVGGESGPHCRPMKLDWVRSLLTQCKAANVPFFLKQLGGHPDKRGGNRALLDGKVWGEMPGLRPHAK